MSSLTTSPEEYMASLPEDRIPFMTDLRSTILQNLPTGFEETVAADMIHYVVPHSLYPNGYHCKPQQPLPFISIASQKNFVALYHMGMYVDQGLLNWFRDEYSKVVSTKLDMGKSCIRFKKASKIPLGLIGELVSKMSPQEWIALYESQIKKGKKS